MSFVATSASGAVCAPIQRPIATCSRLMLSTCAAYRGANATPCEARRTSAIAAIPHTSHGRVLRRASAAAPAAARMKNASRRCAT